MIKKVRILSMALAAVLMLAPCLEAAAAEDGAAQAEPIESEETNDGGQAGAAGEDSAEAAAGKSQDMDLTATVLPAEVAYTVTVPSAVSLGTVDADGNVSIKYEVPVEIIELAGGTLRISSPSEGCLVLRDASGKTSKLPYANAFGTQYFTESGIAYGTLTVKQEDIEKADAGQFVGSIVFTIDYIAPGTEAGDEVVTKAISVRTDADFSKESMCDPMFYPEAQIVLNGDGTAAVTVYCVNPIPGFASEGTPITTMLVSGQREDAKGGSGGSDYEMNPEEGSYSVKAEVERKALKKAYEASGAFIPEAGEYTSDAFTFTIPVKAIRESANGTVCADAYVNAVMKSWQAFYLVFYDVEDLGKTGIEYGGYTVRTDSETAGSSVDGLKEYAEEKKEGEYTFTLSRAKGAASGGDAAEQAGISACADLIASVGKEGTEKYYSFTLSYENEEGTYTVADTGDSVMEIQMPLALGSNQELSVYRHHEDGSSKQTGKLAALSKKPSAAARLDGTWYLDQSNGKLYIYGSKFSVYALHIRTTGTSASGGGGSGSGDSGSGTETTKYTAPVSMRKSTDINSASMCDGLFYDYADLEVNGSGTKLTLYVIDPIPNYASEGTPLSSVSFKTSSGTVNASVDSANKVSRYYDEYTSFISKAGNYNSDVITVTLPTSALKNTGSGTVLCTAYVNAVMKSTQSFYVVLGDWKAGETGSYGEAESVDSTLTVGDGTASGAAVAAAGSATGTLRDSSYTAKVSMHKAADINSLSMCNSLFYNYADLEVSGDSTKMTLYVIDPIPNYASEGTPLSDVTFQTSSGTVSASVDSANKVSKPFNADASFIPSAGDYPTDVITVTLPTAALQNTAQGTVLCTAYVNAVMKSTQSFYVLLEDWTSGSSSQASGAGAVGVGGTGGSGGSQSSGGADSAKALEEGIYQVPVSALKDNSDEASMMGDYMYPYADLEVTSSQADVTVYIQHTVAGKENGGPKWMKYKGVEADKKENAKTIGGIAYDSFTITAENPVPSILRVEMFINAMNMEVAARLVLDLEKAGAGGEGGPEGLLTSIDGETPLASILLGESTASGLLLAAKSTGLKVLLALITSGLAGLAGYAGFLQLKKKKTYV